MSDKYQTLAAVTLPHAVNPVIHASSAQNMQLLQGMINKLGSGFFEVAITGRNIQRMASASFKIGRLIEMKENLMLETFTQVAPVIDRFAKYIFSREPTRKQMFKRGLFKGKGAGARIDQCLEVFRADGLLIEIPHESGSLEKMQYKLRRMPDVATTRLSLTAAQKDKFAEDCQQLMIEAADVVEHVPQQI